jgi:hypothetical protein
MKRQSLFMRFGDLRLAVLLPVSSTFQAGRTFAASCSCRSFTHGAECFSVIFALLWPSKIETCSTGTPASSISTANVSRSMCGWQRCIEPSSRRRLAILNSRRKLRCQLPTTDLGEPFPDQKKYRGLGLGPGGMFRRDSATSGGEERRQDCRFWHDIETIRRVHSAGVVPG